jgi:hypothetical protein
MKTTGAALAAVTNNNRRIERIKVRCFILKKLNAEGPLIAVDEN